jgi:hypothetical protein
MLGMRVPAIVWGGCLLVAACSRPPVPPVATIDAPADGWMGSLPLTFNLTASGTTIAAVADQRSGGAHFHLFVNTDLSPDGEPIPAGQPNVIHLGGGQTSYTFDSLPAGNYRVILVLGDNAHVPLPGQKTDTVNFMVH